jgi:hypothetical protein
MAEEYTGSGATPTNVSDDNYNIFDETEADGDTGATSVYKPEEGKYGPKPYGDFTPPEYDNGGQDEDKTYRAPQQQQYQEPAYDEQGQPVESVDPLEELMPYMSDEELNFVGSLPPQQQGYFLNAAARIKGVFETQAEQVAEYESQLEAVAEEIEPIKDMVDVMAPKIEEHGMFDDASDYFECLVEADMQANEDPYTYILDFMRYHQIQFTDLMDNAEVYVDNINDPNWVAAQKAQQERDAYASYLQEVEAERQESEYNQSVDEYAQQINEFREEADEYGYLHPYYDMVEDKMGELMVQQQNVNLDDLYDQACWLVPEVRADIIANGGGYDQGYDQGYYEPQQYYQPSPSYSKFATESTGGDAVYNPSSGDDDFKSIFERNYKRFIG